MMMMAPTAKRTLLEASRKGQRALTLAAALVAAALVGLLVALLLVAVWTARGAAHRATCTSHLRQLASALAMYHEEHGDYPVSYYEIRDGEGELRERVTWQQALLPYVGNASVFLCPRDSVAGYVAESRPAESIAPDYKGSYVYLAREPPLSPPPGSRRAASPAGRAPAEGGASRKAGLLLVCRHHDDEEAAERHWVLAAYDDGAVKWERAPSHLFRRREGDRREAEPAPRPGRNDW